MLCMLRVVTGIYDLFSIGFIRLLRQILLGTQSPSTIARIVGTILFNLGGL